MTRDALALAGLGCITLASFLTAFWVGLLVAGVVLIVVAVLLSITAQDDVEAPPATPEPPAKAWSGIHVPKGDDEPDDTLQRLIERDKPKFKGPIRDWTEAPTE